MYKIDLTIRSIAFLVFSALTYFFYLLGGLGSATIIVAIALLINFPPSLDVKFKGSELSIRAVNVLFYKSTGFILSAFYRSWVDGSLTMNEVLTMAFTVLMFLAFFRWFFVSIRRESHRAHNWMKVRKSGNKGYMQSRSPEYF